jgi:OHCU decarboxylase
VSVAVAELDVMPASEAATVLRSCCGATRWVDAMIAHRPFGSRDALFAAADDEWSRCTSSDWLEAFAHHPRIGERNVEGAAAAEQSGAQDAGRDIQEELRRANQAYEKKFGHIYIVCATGKTAEEMLEIARNRMSNDPQAELCVAAEQQRKIMQIRLRKLVGDDT